MATESPALRLGVDSVESAAVVRPGGVRAEWPWPLLGCGTPSFRTPFLPSSVICHDESALCAAIGRLSARSKQCSRGTSLVGRTATAGSMATCDAQRTRPPLIRPLAKKRATTAANSAWPAGEGCTLSL
eukprot:scaffold69159_cov118-Phaeocystis_antarctica.AAC.2